MTILDDQHKDVVQGPDAASFEAAPAQGAKPLALTMAFADYDRTRPLIDGRVRFDGIDAKIVTDHIGAFCLRPVYEEYDVAEMSLSWYVAARARGEPVIALPVFPLRMPVLAYLFCRSDAPYREPRDLIGKRIATMGYRFTVNLWLRGIMQDHYGLRPEQLSWVTEGQEGAGYVVPAGIDVTVAQGRKAEDLLMSDEVDALCYPDIPDGIRNDDPRIRRLFPDARAEQARYFAETNIFPITHTLVVGERLLKAEPWIAERLVKAFREAQHVVDAAYDEPKHLSLADAIFTLEEQRRAYRRNLYTHGIAGNRHIIETFVRYAQEQGYIPERLDVDGLFVPVAEEM